MACYDFTFDSAQRARIYVERVAHSMVDVALLVDPIDPRHITVLESEDPPRREEIYRLARQSQAIRVVVVE